MFSRHVRPERFSVVGIRAAIKPLLRSIIYYWNPVPHHHHSQLVFESGVAWVQIQKSWIVMVIHKASKDGSEIT